MLGKKGEGEWEWAEATCLLGSLDGGEASRWEMGGFYKRHDV